MKDFADKVVGGFLLDFSEIDFAPDLILFVLNKESL